MKMSRDKQALGNDKILKLNDIHTQHIIKTLIYNTVDS